jgi:UDP-3-O-[3-hydroxymyristoyl] N-acetylglucosamine deacetylase
MAAQKTLRKDIEIGGIGVHSGKAVRLRLRPSDAGKIVFRRTDLAGAEIPLDIERARSLSNTILEGDGFKVQTTEHLLATLWAAGIGSCLIELDADEIPIMDGSAKPFVEAIEKAGTEEIESQFQAFRITQVATVVDKDAWIRFEPAGGEDKDNLTLSYTISYDHSKIGTQSRTFSLAWPEFAREIAPARTFGFLKDVEWFRRQGLAAGTSYENTIVLGDSEIVNPPLRFPDEFVRHKLLDLAGDLALLGRPLVGRVTAHKAGHRLHLQAVRRLLENRGT